MTVGSRQDDPPPRHTERGHYPATAERESNDDSLR